MAKFCSFLWLSSIPLYSKMYSTSSVSIHRLMDTCTYFHILAIEIMLLWTLGCMYLFQLEFLFFSDIYAGVGLLDHMVILFLVFWETSILFSTVAAPVYIPRSREWESLLLHILIAFGVVSVLGFGHSHRRVVESYCFNLLFPNDVWCWTFFHMLTCHLYILFGEVYAQVFCLFFNQVVCFLVVEF